MAANGVYPLVSVLLHVLKLDLQSLQMEEKWKGNAGKKRASSIREVRELEDILITIVRETWTEKAHTMLKIINIWEPRV